MKKIIVFILGCLATLPIFLILSYFSLPLASPAFQNYFIIKDYINQTTPKDKKRLIIMSASDGMFGIIGELIDKETQYFPINYSIFFGTGLDIEFRFDKLLHSLKDGDTLLLPLNYAFYSTKKNNQYFSYYQNMISWGNPNFLYSHPLLSLKTLFKSPPSRLFSGFITHIKAKLQARNLIAKTLQRWNQNIQTFNQISINSLDRYGELRYHQGTLLKQDTTEQYLSQNSEIEDYFLSHYKRLKSFCNQHNIKILFTYPPMLENVNFNLNNPKDLQKIKNLQSQLHQYGITLLGNPKDFQFPIQDFYDSPNHLNTQGAIKYTKELIKILQAQKQPRPPS